MELGIEGPLLLTPLRHADARGFLSEVHNRRTLRSAGIEDDFVQENHVYSEAAGTVRGLHYQVAPAQAAKLVRVVAGSILDVAVDLRSDSPTYGSHVSATLSSTNWSQLYLPVGFAHGLCTLEPDTEVVYWSSAYWDADTDRGIAWDDPQLGIDWPVDSNTAVVSEKDRIQPTLGDIGVISWT